MNDIFLELGHLSKISKKQVDNLKKKHALYKQIKIKIDKEIIGRIKNNILKQTNKSLKRKTIERIYNGIWETTQINALHEIGKYMGTRESRRYLDEQIEQEVREEGNWFFLLGRLSSEVSNRKIREEHYGK